MGFGPIDEIGDDQKVTGKAHLHDRVALILQALLVARCFLPINFGIGKQCGQPHLQPGTSVLPHEVIKRDSSGRWECRQAGLT